MSDAKTQSKELMVAGEQRLYISADRAYSMINDLVLRTYLSDLKSFKVDPLGDEVPAFAAPENIRLFQITKMVYSKDESSYRKFATVFSALATQPCSVFTVMHYKAGRTTFYLGVRTLDPGTADSCGNLLKGVVEGNFPGTAMENIPSNGTFVPFASAIFPEKFMYENLDPEENVGSFNLACVSAASSQKQKDIKVNSEYVQGLEKLALAMGSSSDEYTAIVLASPVSQQEVDSVREGYEQIATALSTRRNVSMSWGTTSSEAWHTSSSSTTGTSHGTSHTEGSSTSQQTKSRFLRLIPVIGNMIYNNKTVSTNVSDGTSSTSQSSTTKSTSQDKSTGTTSQRQYTVQDKQVEGVLERIDKILNRFKACESVGMWETATYFMSTSGATVKKAAAIYKALMSGEDSDAERAAINDWYRANDPEQFDALLKYVRNLRHPSFQYPVNETVQAPAPITPASLVSSNEVAIQMGLPRHAVPGFPVMEHADFAMEKIRYGEATSQEDLTLGHVFSRGQVFKNLPIGLDRQSLAMHTLIVGATGCGKSNTVYAILNGLLKSKRANFLVVEPAKGEYRRIFSEDKDVVTYGTNSTLQGMLLLRINPFAFPAKIHLSEHIDRLGEIFNVCWPMYAAMPALLKEAMFQAYKDVGWDIETPYRQKRLPFPTFKHLLVALEKCIQESQYSEEVKANYVGSLVTRVKSLTNGLCGPIFCSEHTCMDHLLFDQNVIVDLSRIGSQETKSLIMGVLVMRLSEYRMSQATEPNQPLKHVTVLEEAHNLLRSSEKGGGYNSEGGENIAGKSVEMLSNAIAEMRTYGEGFIIADQAPGALDISAIRNTNTKIIMRLPEESDRRSAGKSAGLKDEQIDEIAKLPLGVAVVYQNDWVQPVLCKINKFEKKGDNQ